MDWDSKGSVTPAEAHNMVAVLLQISMLPMPESLSVPVLLNRVCLFTAGLKKRYEESKPGHEQCSQPDMQLGYSDIEHNIQQEHRSIYISTYWTNISTWRQHRLRSYKSTAVSPGSLEAPTNPSSCEAASRPPMPRNRRLSGASSIF